MNNISIIDKYWNDYLSYLYLIQLKIRMGGGGNIFLLIKRVERARGEPTNADISWLDNLTEKFYSKLMLALNLPNIEVIDLALIHTYIDI